MLSLHLQFDTAEKDTELLYIYSYKIVILSLNLITDLWFVKKERNVNSFCCPFDFFETTFHR